MNSEAVTEAILHDPQFTCEVCKRVDGGVRSCCYRPARQRLCQSCYIGGKGDHATHVGDQHELEMRPRESVPWSS